MRDRQAHRLKQLKAERSKLLQAHYADAIPLELLKVEQRRISDEMARLQESLKVVEATAERLRATAETAVSFTRDCHRMYVEAPDRERRIMNQAFFKKVWVTEDGVSGWEYNQPFAALVYASAPGAGAHPGGELRGHPSDRGR